MKTIEITRMTAAEAASIHNQQALRATVMHNLRDWRREQQVAADEEAKARTKLAFKFFNPVLPPGFRIPIIHTHHHRS